MSRIANGLLRALLSAGALAAAVLFASLATSPASAQRFQEFPEETQMPPRGGNDKLTDHQVEAAVAWGG